MNRRWRNHRYVLVERDRGAGRSDLTLFLGTEVLFWREYDYSQKRVLSKDIRALVMIGKLREVPNREVAHEPTQEARQQS